MTTRRRIQKMREERFIKSIEDACDTLLGILNSDLEKEDGVMGNLGIAEKLLGKSKRRLERLADEEREYSARSNRLN